MKLTKTMIIALIAGVLIVVAGVSFAQQDKSMPAATATAATATTAATTTTAVATSSGTIDLSGHWKLNRDLSDNPRDKMREAMGNRGGRGEGMRGGMGGGMRGGMGGGMRGGMGGGGTRGGDEGGSPRSRGADPLGIFANDIRISQNATSVDFRAGDNDRVLKTDGSVEEFDTPRGGQMALSSRWEEGKLVVTMKDEMHKTTEHWSIDPESHRLVVVTELDRGEGMPVVTIKKVWDKVND